MEMKNQLGTPLYYQRSPDPKFEVLYKKAIRHPALNRTVLDKVTYQQHAYIDWKITLLTVTRDELKSSGRCEYLLGKERVRRLRRIQHFCSYPT
jgi:hypothetical protein